jgi:hypothetical protein
MNKLLSQTGINGTTLDILPTLYNLYVENKTKLTKLRNEISPYDFANEINALCGTSLDSVPEDGSTKSTPLSKVPEPNKRVGRSLEKRDS